MGEEKLFGCSGVMFLYLHRCGKPCLISVQSIRNAFEYDDKNLGTKCRIQFSNGTTDVDEDIDFVARMIECIAPASVIE